MNTHYKTTKKQLGRKLNYCLICIICIIVNPSLSLAQWSPGGITNPIYHTGEVGIGTSSNSNPSSARLYLKNTLTGAGWNTSNFGQLHDGTYGAYNTGNVWGTLGMHRNNVPGEYFDYGLSCGMDKYGSTFGLMKRPSGGGIMDAYIRWSYNEASDPIAPNDLQFQFNNLALGTSLDAVTFTSTGRVGIGSKTPAEKLVVYSTDITPFKAWQNENVAYNYCGVFQVQNPATKAIVVSQGGWTESFIVMGDGTINPWAQTHIGAALKIEGNTSINCAVSGYEFKVNGDGYCTGIWSSSDKNLKYNIIPLSPALDKVMRLKPVNYLFKQDVMIDSGKTRFNLPKGNQIGFLAQDVEEIFPEAVKDADGYKAMNYSMIIPVLTQAMQEQQAIIEKQTENIQQLKDKIDCMQPCNGSINNTTPQLNNAPKLEQNIPNPFGNTTIIRYTLPQGSQQNYIIVSDLSGKQLKKYQINSTGAGQIEIQAKEFNAGSYLYTLISNTHEIDTKKMIIVGE